MMAFKLLYTGEPEKWASSDEALQLPNFMAYYAVFYAVAKIFQTNSFIMNPDAAANWAFMANMALERIIIRSNDRYPVDIVLGSRAARSERDISSINYPGTIPAPEA